VAQGIGEDLLCRLLLEETALDATPKVRHARLDHQLVAGLVGRGLELVELRGDAVDGERRRFVTEFLSVLAKHLAQVVRIRIDGVGRKFRGSPQHLIHRDIGDRACKLHFIAIQPACRGEPAEPEH
jgi:hypothetical protein